MTGQDGDARHPQHARPPHEQGEPPYPPQPSYEAGRPYDPQQPYGAGPSYESVQPFDPQHAHPASEPPQGGGHPQDWTYVPEPMGGQLPPQAESGAAFGVPSPGDAWPAAPGAHQWAEPTPPPWPTAPSPDDGYAQGGTPGWQHGAGAAGAQRPADGYAQPGASADGGYAQPGPSAGGGYAQGGQRPADGYGQRGPSAGNAAASWQDGQAAPGAPTGPPPPGGYAQPSPSADGGYAHGGQRPADGYGQGAPSADGGYGQGGPSAGNAAASWQDGQHAPGAPAGQAPGGGYAQPGPSAGGGYGQGGPSASNGYAQGGRLPADGQSQHGPSAGGGYGQGDPSASDLYGQHGPSAGYAYGQPGPSAGNGNGNGTGTGNGYAQADPSAGEGYGGHGGAGGGDAPGAQPYPYGQDAGVEHTAVMPVFAEAAEGGGAQDAPRLPRQQAQSRPGAEPPVRTGSPIIAPGVQPAAITVALALLTAGGAALGKPALAFVLLALEGLTAAGWFRLNGMWPARQGIALAFLGGVTADIALLAADGGHATEVLLGTLGVWLLLVLVLQMRHHGSPDERLASLTATSVSTLLTVAAASYLATAVSGSGSDPVVVGVCAVAAATLVRAVRLPGGEPVSLVLALLAAAATAAATAPMTGFGSGHGVLLALACGAAALIGLRVASYDFPSRFVHFTAGVALPLTAAAPVVYALGAALS
ncbi:hypothetical protein V2S66_27650 [Streptomyces sp. V4-01]|uniref:Integral membrane protein n=1 Tax=Actinacidiphila polyblastidii TaxID=3110430 RepID=A0ABU7PIS6_9ACTN|nr:hypothetical protein [Streptomyces sp. V4-01]